MTERVNDWGAKPALACYLALVGGGLAGSITVGFILFGMNMDYSDLSFPLILIGSLVNETIFLGITLLFAKRRGASLRSLGLKKVNLKILAIVSITPVLILIVSAGISTCQQLVFGPDPMAEILEQSLLPRDPYQLVAVIVIFLALVGPIEELAFRGFLQKGFENSAGKMKGLLIASALFGLFHGFNSLYSIIPAFAAGLVLGYVWQLTGGNTTASGLVHGLYNTITIMIVYFATV